MVTDFDPYWKWLGIPPEEQPPDHYQLLGIQRFEEDEDVIENAAVRQMAHVRTFQGGEYAELSQQLLNELSAVRVCLLNEDQKQAYDTQLEMHLPIEPLVQTEVPMATPVPAPVSAPPAQQVAPAAPQVGSMPANRTRRRSRRRRQQRSARESQLAWTLVLVSIITLLIAVALGVFLFRRGESNDEDKQALIQSLSIDNTGEKWHPNEF